MTRLITNLLLLFLITGLYSCSTVRVVDSYQSDQASSLKSKKILVIARTANERNRKDFEDAIAQKFRDNGYSAKASYKTFPNIDPTRKLDEEQVKAVKRSIEDAGFNAVVLSVLKDVEEVTRTTFEGGYDAGESLTSYYNVDNYIGFYGFYIDPISYPSYRGVEVSETATTDTNFIYVVETTAYNLDLPPKQQLVAAVTSKIEEPESIYGHANNYAKAIMKELK